MWRLIRTVELPLALLAVSVLAGTSDRWEMWLIAGLVCDQLGQLRGRRGRRLSRPNVAP